MDIEPTERFRRTSDLYGKQVVKRQSSDFHLKGYAGHVPGKKFHPGMVTNSAESQEVLVCLEESHDPRADVAKNRLKDITSPKPSTPLFPTPLELEAMESRTVYKATITPGYAGHIPRANQQIGQTFSVEKVKALNKFSTEQATMAAKDEALHQKLNESQGRRSGSPQKTADRGAY